MSRVGLAAILVTGVITLIAAAIGAGAALVGSWLGGEYQSLVPLQTRLVDSRGVARVLEHDLYERAIALAATTNLLLPREIPPATALQPLTGQIPRSNQPDVLVACLRRTRNAPGRRCRVPTRQRFSNPTSRQVALPTSGRRQLAAALPLPAWDVLSNALDDYNSVTLERATRSRAKRMIRDLFAARYALSVLVHYRTEQEACMGGVVKCSG